MIQLTKVCKTYNGMAGQVPALIDIDIQIQKGESVAIVGKSGSGKSTLLNILSGIDRSDSGEVSIAGSSINTMGEEALARWRGQNVGIVFQSFQLIPTLCAIDNVRYPMDLVKTVPKKTRAERAMHLLAEVGLADKAKKFPNELSGGEVQRVAIARAIANDPLLLLADEPTGNLDSSNGEQIYALFSKLSKAGKNVVVVTHDTVNAKILDRIIRVQDGRIQLN
ncbi:ABC transporter ATP-binding protein [Cytophagales bacterium WSM2-2]|nr:ABC transporter ATP-binding protein [Cytophagales bacterium WSM2-2]